MIVGTTTGFVSLVVRVLYCWRGGEIVAMIAIDAVFAHCERRPHERAGSKSGPRAVVCAALRPGLADDDRPLRAIASIGIVITWVVFQRSEVFFLQYYSTPEQIAIYSIPFTAVTALMLFPQAVSSSLGRR